MEDSNASRPADAGQPSGSAITYRAARPERYSRLQLLLRVVAFGLVGVLGLSFCALFAVAYFGLPVLAALRVRDVGSERYLSEDGPRLILGLHWLAAVCAWLGLLVEAPSSGDLRSTVRLKVDTSGAKPTVRGALERWASGLPSALIFLVLSLAGFVMWLLAAFRVLWAEQVGDVARDFLARLQEWAVRLMAYQAGLVDEPPPTRWSAAESSAPGPAQEV